MRHQVTNRISMFEPRGIAGSHEPPLHMRAPMFFVGIEREVAPPLVFGQNRFQRMRVILVEPGEAIDLAGAGDDSLPEVLPPLPAPPHHLALQPRLVQGEILRGENDEKALPKRLAGASAACVASFPGRAARFWMSSPSRRLRPRPRKIRLRSGSNNSKRRPFASFCPTRARGASSVWRVQTDAGPTARASGAFARYAPIAVPRASVPVSCASEI